jgi:hypothetical protein
MWSWTVIFTEFLFFPALINNHWKFRCVFYYTTHIYIPTKVTKSVITYSLEVIMQTFHMNNKNVNNGNFSCSRWSLCVCMLDDGRSCYVECWNILCEWCRQTPQCGEDFKLSWNSILHRIYISNYNRIENCEFHVYLIVFPNFFSVSPE